MRTPVLVVRINAEELPMPHLTRPMWIAAALAFAACAGAPPQPVEGPAPGGRGLENEPSSTGHPSRELAFESAALPARLEIAVAGAAPGSLVLLGLGTQPANIELPGGHALGIELTLVVGPTIANADGAAVLQVDLPTGSSAGLTFLAQAVAVHPTLPLAQPQCLVLSPVHTATVPATGDVAGVYVLFGQSNAEGYASVADLPADLRRPMPNARIWKVVGGNFEALAGGVNGRTVTTSAWCGPELTLARSLSATGNTIYLVKLAVGQTALGPTPGPTNEWGVEAGELYALLQSEIGHACMALVLQGLTPRVRGICMMQGESDATDESWATGYQSRLASLVQHFRSDLLQAGFADAAAVPFVLGQIDKDLPQDIFPWVEAVRIAQANVAASTPVCAIVDTTGLSLQDDHTHFDTAGVMTLGNRFAEALQRLPLPD